MKLFSKGLVIAAALCVALLVMQDCSSKKQGLVVGFSQIGSESDWRRAHTKDVKDEAVRLGIELKFSDAQQLQENQIKAVKNFIAQGVDAIILAPIIEDGWEPVLKEAKAAGIPVILSDRGVSAPEDLYVTRVGPDFVVEGRTAGEWLAKKLNGKPCNIVELEGTTGSAPANDRKKGFDEVVAKHPNMKIIKSATGDFKRVKGQEVMDAFIASEGKNIQAVFAHNDDMALGASQSLEAAGMKPGKDVIIVSVDGVRAALEAIKAGKSNCSVECNPLLGKALLEACQKAAKGEILPKQIATPEGLFDSTNVVQALPTRKY